MTKLERLLRELVTHVDEDCPAEYRTKHLRNALTEAIEYVDWIEWSRMAVHGSVGDREELNRELMKGMYEEDV